MRHRLIKRFATNSSGIAATEFALLAPFLIVLVFTSFTLFEIVRATYVADRSTFTIGDLLSRQTETSTAQLGQMKAVFEHLAIDVYESPQLRITSLIRRPSGFIVDWTYNSRPDGTLAKSGLPFDQLPQTAVDDSVLLTESLVSVKPYMNILPAIIGSTMNIAHSATTRPRFVGRLAKVN